jgi:hypothetical protein
MRALKCASFPTVLHTQNRQIGFENSIATREFNVDLVAIKIRPKQSWDKLCYPRIFSQEIGVTNEGVAPKTDEGDREFIRSTF